MSMHLIFNQQQGARALWYFGEDELSKRCLKLSDKQLAYCWKLGGRLVEAHEQGRQLPIKGILDINKATAFTLVTYLEGATRPLKRSIRRSKRDLPPEWHSIAATFSVAEEHRLLGEVGDQLIGQ